MQESNWSGVRTLHIPRWEELPDLDLYMDQVLSYVNGKLAVLVPEDAKPVLTSSMVNNYVKTSIVKPPVKKHYKRYHLAFLFVVVLMKWCYSLSEISELITIYSDLHDKERISRDYDKFVSVFESCLGEVFDTGNMQSVYFDDPSDAQLLMTNVIRTVCGKIYVEAGIARMSVKGKD